MNRPDRDQEEASPADDRFWQAFAQAAGFEDELRELIASGEIDADAANLAAFEREDDLTAEDLLTADRLHESLLAVRQPSVEPVTLQPAMVELVARPSADGVLRGSRRQYGWLAALSIVTLASVAVVAATLFLGDDGTGAGAANAEVASAERLAEEWIALLDEAPLRDVATLQVTEFDADPAVDTFDFEETPEWLVLAIAHKAELSADVVEEAAP
jgi:hypothetical protein